MNIVTKILAKVSSAVASIPAIRNDAAWKAIHVRRIASVHAHRADNAYRSACRAEDDSHLLLKGIWLTVGDHHRDRVFELRTLNKDLLLPAKRLTALRRYRELSIFDRCI